MSSGIAGKRLKLVPLCHERHFENCLAWVNDPVITEWLLIGDEPTTREMEEAWFARMLGGTGTDIVFAIELLDGTHIGQSALHGINHRNKTAVCGTLIAPEYWGKGYGTEASLLRAQYAFHTLGLRMLISGYLEGNPRTPRMLEKQGFVVTGRIPQEQWKRGQYRDHVMAVLMAERFAENQG
jgi:RimJ/RimL family protein N-acetyltransferase